MKKMGRMKFWAFKVDKLLLIVFVVGLLCIGIDAQAQQVKITGVVTASEDKMPIPGVTIVIKGSTNGTITGSDGRYSISAKLGDVFHFSFIGMKDQEIKVSKSIINVEMVSNVIGLEEVVAIGYGSVSKKELTGAVAQVKSEQISRVVTSDMANALQGLVAGVNVTAASGQPGNSSDILIRGISSIDGSNTPLFVVDGVPQEGDPRLDPNEIETIDILKDAASCAIYGTRGAAGVLLITTKQGKAGTLKVNVTGSYGVQDIRSGTPLLNAVDQTYVDFVYQRNLAGIKDDRMNLNTLRSAYSFQYDTDISKIVFKDMAPVQNYTVNISGGAKDITYSVMAGYYNQDGIIINSGFNRFNSRANTTYKNGRWVINASLGLSREETSYSPGGIITQAIKYHPTMLMIDPSSDTPVNTFHGFESMNLGYVLESLKNTDVNKRQTSFASLNAMYTIISGLTISTRIGSNASNDYRHAFNPYQAVYDIDGELTNDPITTSSVTMNSDINNSLTWETGITYKKKFNKVHNLTLLATQSLEQYSFDKFEAARYGVSNNEIQVLDGAVANPSASSGNGNYTNKLFGYIGRVQYDFKNKYLFSASIRRDGSSKFAKDNRWGTFPSASVAWNISDEPFWKRMKKVANGLKLRASYGTVGNQNFRPYSFSAGVAQGLDYAFADEKLVYGSAQASYANGDVKWETTIQSNIGLDLSLLNNKLTFTAEYYNSDKKDMLMPIEVAASNGSAPNINLSSSKSSTVFLNLGDMTNKGLELALSYRTKTGKINWNFNGTFSTNKNKVTKVNGLGGITMLDDYGLISGKKSTSQITGIAEGYEAGAFFIFKTNGLINTNDKLLEYQKLNPDARMGDLIYVDSNNDGILSEKDRVYGGSGLAKYEAGLSITADYKGFDFSMRWYSAIGHEIMNGAKATAYGWGRDQELLDQWSVVNPTSSIPAYRGQPGDHPNYNGYTDLWLEDGTYLRLKEITLGYTLPHIISDKIGVNECRLYITAQNPLTFTNYTGYDPEVGGNISSRGLDKGNYPVTSLYTVGFNLKF